MVYNPLSSSADIYTERERGSSDLSSSYHTAYESTFHQAGDLMLRCLGLCVLAIIVIQVGRAPLFESLWLDELLTQWIISTDSIEETTARAYQYQAQSPLYFILLKVWLSWWEVTPFFLRLPSLIFCYGTIGVLVLLGREFRVKEPLVLLGLPLLSLDSVVKAAVTARPYSLALFFATLSTLMIVRYTHSRKPLSLVLYAITLLITFYLHYLFAAIGLVHLVWLWIARERLRSTEVGLITLAFGLCIGAAIPGISHAYEWSQRDLGVYLEGVPTFEVFLTALVPAKLLILGLCCFVASWLFLPWPLGQNVPRGALFFCLTWAFLPPVCLYLISSFTGSSLLIERYGLWRAGGFAATVGLLSAAIPRIGARRLFAILWILLLGTFELQRTWTIENWSEAATFVKEIYPESPILFYSGLKEAECRRCRSDEEFKRYLLSPLQTLGITNATRLLAEYPTNDDVMLEVLNLGDPGKLLYVGLPRTRNLSFENIKKLYSPLNDLLLKEFNLSLEAQHTFGRVVILSYVKKTE